MDDNKADSEAPVDLGLDLGYLDGTQIIMRKDTAAKCGKHTFSTTPIREKNPEKQV